MAASATGMQSPYKDPQFRGRAAESMQAQRKLLSKSPRPERRGKGEQQLAPGPRGAAESATNADKLRSMLTKLAADGDPAPGREQFELGKRSVRHTCQPGTSCAGEAPSPEETMLVLEHQTAYAQQMENELHFTKEELSVTKVKLAECMRENVRLQSDLRQNVLKEIVSQHHRPGITQMQAPLLGGSGNGNNCFDGIQPPAATTVPTANTSQVASAAVKADFGKWQLELDRISALHKARNEALEAQLSYSKDELLRCRSHVDELQSKLRQQESLTKLLIGNSSGGSSTALVPELQPRLCVSCARAPGIALPVASTAVQQMDWEQLQREKEEATDALSRAMAQLDAAQSREEDSRDRVRACVELVEQTQREKGEAVVQREQAREELERVKQRCDAVISDLQRQLAVTREAARKDRQREVDELEIRLKRATEDEAASKEELLRMVRERRDVDQQLQQAKLAAQQGDVAVAEATSRLRIELSRLSLERDSAVEERSKIKASLKKMESSHDEAIERLRTEADCLRQRLDSAEHASLVGKEEAIKLITENQQLQKELASSKMAYSNLQRDRNEEQANMTSRFEKRERELVSQLEATEEQLCLYKQDLQTKLDAQCNLITKLREECRRQASIIESTSSKHRSQMRQMKADSKALSGQLASAQQAIQRLNEQLVEHVRVHDELRQQLSGSDGAVQELTHINDHLKGKNQELFREIEILNNEIKLLRLYAVSDNALHTTTNGTLQQCPRPSGMISDILTALSSDMVDQDRSLQNGIQILRQAVADNQLQ